MPVRFQVLNKHDVVYVRYDGVARIQEAAEAFAEFSAHPDCRPGQKHLIDMSRLTSIDEDYPRLIRLQAKKTDVYLAEGEQTLLVYFAPTRVARELAHTILRSWERLDSIVALILEEEHQVLETMGLDFDSVEDLLASEHS